MPRFIYLLCVLLVGCPVLLCAQTPAYAWATTCGSFSSSGTGSTANGPAAVAADAQGYSTVVGSFDGTATFGPFTLISQGLADIFVARLDARGNCLWAVAAGGPANDAAQAVTVDAQGQVFLTGTFASSSVGFGAQTLFNSGPTAEVFVASLDPQGRWRWARRAGGPDDDRGRALALTPQGEVLVAGSFNSANPDFGPVQLTNSRRFFDDVFVARLSPAGTWLGAVSAGGTGDDRAWGVVCDAQGRAYLSGTYQSMPITFGTHTLTTTSTGQGTGLGIATKVFVAALDLSANSWSWAASGGAVAGPSGAGSNYAVLALDGAGGLYAAGSFSGLQARFGPHLLHNPGRTYTNPNGNVYYTTDGFVTRLEAGTGAWTWARRLGSDTDDHISTVAVGTGGQLAVGGAFTGPTLTLDGTPITLTAATSGQAFAAQLDGATGTWQWARGNGPNEAASMGVAYGAAGQLLAFGTFRTTLTCDHTVLANPAPSPARAGFVAQLGSVPLATAHQWATARFELWPNPARHAVQVRGPAPGQPVQLHDALGRQAAAASMPAAGPLHLRLPANLPAGLYWLRAAGHAAQALRVE